MLLLLLLQAQLPYLGLPQSSRALVSSVALGFSPPEPWISSYLQRFKASLSELNPEGLVDVLRSLSTANALPSHQWLKEFEQDLERRFGFVGPVELSTSAFLFANLGHIPSGRWRERFLAEALKFRVSLKLRPGIRLASQVRTILVCMVHCHCKVLLLLLRATTAKHNNS